jgi:hypothetical protein
MSMRAGLARGRETVDTRSKIDDIHRERRRQTAVDDARTAFLDDEVAQHDGNRRLATALGA